MRASFPTEQALTAEQTAALGDYRARWAAVRRSIAPADRGTAERAVRLAYRAAGLAPPARIVWCDGPHALAGRISPEDGRNVRFRLVDRLRRRAASRVETRVHRKVLAAIDSAVNPADPLVAAAAEAVTRSVPELHLSMLGHLRRTGLSFSGLIQAFVAPRGFSSCAAGPYDLSWLGVYDYLRDVLGLRAETKPLRGLIRLATSVGWLGPYEHTCRSPSDRICCAVMRAAACITQAVQRCAIRTDGRSGLGAG
jgi:hypothetical protein